MLMLPADGTSESNGNPTTGGRSMNEHLIFYTGIARKCRGHFSKNRNPNKIGILTRGRL